MRIKSLIILFLLCVTKIYSQEFSDLNISGSFQNLSFFQFVNRLEDEYPIKFYFKEEWVKDVEVNFEVDSISLTDVLERVFISTFRGFVINADGNIYITPDRKFVIGLPEYSSSVTEKFELSTEREQTNIEEKYLRGREPDMISTIEVGKLDPSARNRRCIINGKLVNSSNGDPLIGATIYIQELQMGEVTDVNGSLRLSIEPGKYEAAFQCMGMTSVKCILDVKSQGYFTLQMEPELTSIAEVTVTADQTYTRGSKTGLETISIKTIKELPTLMGEKDVMKIAQMLPGVVSVSEGAPGVNVRGGNVDQNLFYLNSIPVYNTSHLFGFFSAINTDIINNFSIYKGHVPAQYGGRLSSVFNVDTRKGNKNKFFAQGGISPISAQVSAEIPVIKKKASVMLSARSSYSDWILNQLRDPALRNSSASFYDFAGGVDYVINENNHIDFFAYNSNDVFNLNELTEYQYSNMGMALNYSHWFLPGLKSNITLVNSEYQTNSIDKSTLSASYQQAHQLQHKEFKYSMSWFVNHKHKLTGGFGSIVYDLDRGEIEPYGAESKIQNMPMGDERGIESSLFIDDTYLPFYWLELYGGFRYSNYKEMGPKQVYTYMSNLPKNKFTVADSSDYKAGEVISTYQGPEFRVAMDFKLNANNSIKLSYIQMRQYLFMLSNTFAVAPNDQWKLADSHLTPPKSMQYSGGYYFKKPGKGYSASVEGYYKYAQNIIEYQDGADFHASPHVERLVLQGDQKAYGLEFMLAKDKGQLNGWFSYTYSRSFIKVDGEYKWDKINKGKKYPSNYDKPHVINLVLNYRFNRRFILSSTVAYSSGRPITLPQNIFYIRGNPFVDYSERNAYRVPDYFRTDLSLTVEGNLKKKKIMHSYWVFSVYNLTGRKNPYSIYFKSEERYLHGYQYSVIGTPIFTVSWNFKLGNYVNN